MTSTSQAQSSSAAVHACRSEATGKRSLFIVKMTDSCLEALVKRGKSKSGRGLRINVEEGGKQGSLTINDPISECPSASSSSSAGVFTWQSQTCLNTDAVLDHAHKGHSFNSIMKRLTIAADEQQSFAQTKQRAAQLQTSKEQTQALKKVNDSKMDYKVNKMLQRGRLATAKADKDTLLAGAADSRSAVVDMDVSVRSHVIHQLALKPMTRQVLLDRLLKCNVSKHSIHDAFDTALAQVGVESSVNSAGVQCYKLNGQYWEEVAPHQWPHYASLDRVVAVDNKKNSIKRRQKELKAKQAASSLKPDSAKGDSALNMCKSSSGARAMVTSRVPRKRGLHSPEPTEADRGPSPAKKTTTPPPPTDKEPSPPAPTTVVADEPMALETDTRPSRVAHCKQKVDKNTDVGSAQAPVQSVGQVADTVDTFDPGHIPDFTEKLPPVKNQAEYDNYRNIFNRDYPKYLKAYKEIAKVSELFNELGKRLEQAEPDTKLHKQVESEIQMQFVQYQQSETFTQYRRQHLQLRSKLTVLKDRIRLFEIVTRDRAQGIVPNTGVDENLEPSRVSSTNAAAVTAPSNSNPPQEVNDMFTL